MTADFQTDLAWSNAQSDAPWWEKVYRQAFPDFAGMHRVPSDGWAQRGGIDRIIVLSSGKTLSIDEKCSRKDWPAFCIEYWSSEEHKRPGWVAKDLACDFIAYAFAPSGRCYLLPFQTLRRAWRLNGREWVDSAKSGAPGYKDIRARNRGYTTVSVGVPIGDVLSAITDAILVRVEPDREVANG